jgi:hypothetical protein
VRNHWAGPTSMYIGTWEVSTPPHPGVRLPSTAAPVKPMHTWQCNLECMADFKHRLCDCLTSNQAVTPFQQRYRTDIVALRRGCRCLGIDKAYGEVSFQFCKLAICNSLYTKCCNLQCTWICPCL